MIRNTTKTFLTSWLLQLQQMHTKPPAIIRLSMDLLYHQCPHSIWSILSYLRIALSPNATKKLYRIANQISMPDRLQWIDHETIAITGI